MKNKFLLLGATALLSAGAMGVMADSSVTIPIRAQVVTMNSFNVAQSLDFGTVSYSYPSTGGYGDTVIVAPSGAVSGATNYFGGAHQAIIDLIPTGPFDSSFNEGYELVFPEEPVNLTFVASDTEKSCGSVSNFTQAKSGTIPEGLEVWGSLIHVGATYTISHDSIGSSTEAIAQECTGSVIATVVFTGTVTGDGKTTTNP